MNRKTMNLIVNLILGCMSVVATILLAAAGQSVPVAPVSFLPASDDED